MRNRARWLLTLSAKRGFSVMAAPEGEGRHRGLEWNVQSTEFARLVRLEPDLVRSHKRDLRRLQGKRIFGGSSQFALVIRKDQCELRSVASDCHCSECRVFELARIFRDSVTE